MKTVNLRPHLKRNILIAAVLLLVCAAAFLNWSYNQRWGDGNSAMADAEDEMTTAVNAADGAPEETVSAALPASVSGYFSEARLTRQQSRDQALSLLETAACAESASQDVIDSAMKKYGDLTAYDLVELSHRKGGAWSNKFDRSNDIEITTNDIVSSDDYKSEPDLSNTFLANVESIEKEWRNTIRILGDA